jgi:hypothetical protein
LHYATPTVRHSPVLIICLLVAYYRHSNLSTAKWRSGEALLSKEIVPYFCLTPSPTKQRTCIVTSITPASLDFGEVMHKGIDDGPAHAVSTSATGAERYSRRATELPECCSTLAVTTCASLAFIRAGCSEHPSTTPWTQVPMCWVQNHAFAIYFRRQSTSHWKRTRQSATWNTTLPNERRR